MPRSHRRIAIGVVAAAAIVVYWRTAYPTITWWDSANYSLTSYTLGNTSPPGSLLLTLLGWPISHLPIGMTPARLLNLFAGLLAAGTIVFVLLTALRMTRASGEASEELPPAVWLAATGGALGFAFTATQWEHAIKFNPYVLTALFTALILWTMVRWWEVADDAQSWRLLLLLGFLFGLDFSVHRTNALLIPGAIAWVLLRRPRIVAPRRAAAAAVSGLTVGLLVHLLLIPIGRFSNSPVKMYEPGTLASFWSYVSLEPLGGNFLLNLLPRKSDFWSVQIADFTRTFAENFLHSGSVFGIVSAAVMVTGVVMLVRQSRSMGVAWIVALSLQIALTIFYFNIPAGFFRPFDRHYLPIFVMCGVTMAFGAAMVAQRVASPGARWRGFVLATIAVGFLVVPQLSRNWKSHDASRRYFAEDFARNTLESLPPNAILLTVGDNDTFPLMYMRHAQRVRPDVEVLNLGLFGLPWYRAQILRRDPTFPTSEVLAPGIAPYNIRSTSRLVVPIAGTSDSVILHTRPQYGNTFIAPDSALISLIIRNQWRRPVAFAITAGDPGWLKQHTRVEGLYRRVVPRMEAAGESPLASNLLSYEYRGYADSSVMMEPETRTMAFQYLSVFTDLFGAELDRGQVDECKRSLAHYLRVFPSHRLDFGEHAPRVELSCGA